jgi:hypothetical protein
VPEIRARKGVALFSGFSKYMIDVKVNSVSVSKLHPKMFASAMRSLITTLRTDSTYFAAVIGSGSSSGTAKTENPLENFTLSRHLFERRIRLVQLPIHYQVLLAAARLLPGRPLPGRQAHSICARDICFTEGLLQHDGVTLRLFV